MDNLERGSKKKVEKSGVGCVTNRSTEALLYTLTAEVIFTSTSFGLDVNYCFPKKKRKFVYLVHGMPVKKAMYDQDERRMANGNIADCVYRKFVAGFQISDLNYITNTSEFFSSYLKDAFRSERIFITGLPRNDALLYPVLFANEDHINDYFKYNNILLLIKHHPNMSHKVLEIEDKSNIIDITKYGYDAQKILYHTCILITNYSSVWIAFLLLKRPIIFFLYDDCESKDNETYYEMRKAGVGQICVTESQLFFLVSKIFHDYENYSPTERIVKLYHKYIDAYSCERLYSLLNSEIM